MKKPVVRLEDDNFGAVLNCAVRYSIGRMTYMPHLVQSYIRPLLPYLSNKTLYVMERDIAEAGSYGDPHIDEPDWMRFLSEVRNARKAREEDGNGWTVD